jgi:hypothetical protein
MAWPIGDPRWRWVHWPLVLATGLLFCWNLLGWLGAPVPWFDHPFRPLVTLAICGMLFTQALADVLAPPMARRARAVVPFWIVPFVIGVMAH